MIDPESIQAFTAAEDTIREGGGPKAVERQHAKGRLTARERVAGLIDEGSFFQEYGLWAAQGMYAEHGGAPAAGVVTGVGVVHGRRHMIIANDATVKAGAFFPMTCKKIIRAQTMAHLARLPLLYLVDSAGVYLPLQEDVFPDTDDFGRIFRNNAVISADGVPQIAAIMGNCVAGGGYLPVLCDTLLMTEGSGLYLAGPALVKAAIGQEVTDEELGGALMHEAISGTIDFKEPDDESCLRRLRELVGKYPDCARTNRSCGTGVPPVCSPDAVRPGSDLATIFTDEPGQQYDVLDIISCIVDSRAEPNADGLETLAPDFDEYKSDYGASLVCGYANLGGSPVGILANQGKLTQRHMPGGKAGPSTAVNMPRVLYNESADKAARFIMDCNQRKIPLVFLHDTTGFMVGRDSEQAGIIRSGAKMVNAMANSVVPKVVLIMGGSYGAGNYAMCGRAFDQFVSLAWPNAKCSVMGAAQATGVLAMIEERSRARKGEEIDDATRDQILQAVRDSYNEQQDIRHGAARGWVDRLIDPANTREELIAAVQAAVQGWDFSREFKTGVLQT
ncbi:MAG: 3-methylcrotonyl-CoA carboxylase beta subunit [Phycisphaerales bacterium]|jgi:3-methylcrotonyl-CoA carboxylase beta subunit